MLNIDVVSFPLTFQLLFISYITMNISLLLIKIRLQNDSFSALLNLQEYMLYKSLQHCQYRCRLLKSLSS